MDSRRLFLAACRHERVDRPPVWLMRQAGRYLPEYQKIKARYDFMEMCRTPDLAVEISLQPWRRFGMDAVIVFSDILIPCEAMGQELYFDEQGPHLSPLIHSEDSLKKLSLLDPEKTRFLFETLSILKRELKDKAALIGFCGSPWTTAAYMMGKANTVIKEDPKILHALLEKVTRSLIPYVQGQIDSGVDMIQIFDTWGGRLSREEYRRFSLPYISEMIKTIDKRVPVAVYCQNNCTLIDLVAQTGCDILSIDWTLSLQEARQKIPSTMGLQGNLDPQILFQSLEDIRKSTQAMLASNARHPGYIANLGHGVMKGTPVESVKAFVDTVTK